MDLAFATAVPQFHGGSESQITHFSMTMADSMQKNRQQSGIQRTVMVMVLLATMMFVSAAFVGYGA